MDEINLAAAETLECLSGLLEGSSGSLVLLDRGDTGIISMLAYALYLDIQLSSLSYVAQNKLRSFTIKMNVCTREQYALCRFHTSLQVVCSQQQCEHCCVEG